MKRGIFKIIAFYFSVAVVTAFCFPYRRKLIVFAAENNASQAVCVMEQSSRRILYEYNGDVRLPMASTTKIATAATVLDMRKDLSEKVVIPRAAVGIEGSSVYLKENDEYSIQDLLYGLMLRSGNDCATALALYCSGKIDGFC